MAHRQASIPTTKGPSPHRASSRSTQELISALATLYKPSWNSKGVKDDHIPSPYQLKGAWVGKQVKRVTFSEKMG